MSSQVAIIPPGARSIVGATMDNNEWTVNHFSQANPEGPGQGDVPALLRRVAESIEALGDVDVQDAIMDTEVTAEGSWVSMTVYYKRD